MYIQTVSTLLSVISFVSAPLQAQSLWLEDRFEAPQVDPNLWNVVLPSSTSQVYPSSGELVLVDRGWLASTPQVGLPGTHFRIEADCRTVQDSDILTVVVYSDAQVGGAFDTPTDGLECQIWWNGSLGINTLGGSVSVPAPVSTNIGPIPDHILFHVEIDGTLARASVIAPDTMETIGEVSTEFSLAPGAPQRFIIFNREMGQTAYLDRVSIFDLSDCNQNGVPDADDIASGTAQDCNTNGIPDSCDLATLDCDQNGLIDSCEFAAGTATDCDANGLIDTCEIADDPATVDRNGNGVLDACECAVENYCVAQGNSSGQVATISASGLPSLGLNELVLHAQGAPAQKFGMFLYGRQENFVFSGDGALCVKPPLFRLYPLLVTDGGGAASRALDLGGAPFSSGPGQVQAGETWRFQFWFRDPAGGFAGFNFSDGLAVTFCP